MNDIHPLIKQLQSSGKAPNEQLDNVFEVLSRIPDAELQQTEQQVILQYLTQLAKSWKIHQPDAFARQLIFMVTDAKRKQLAQPESQALQHARIAAKALIAAQRKNRFSRNSHVYAMAASVLLMFGVSSMMLSNTLIPETTSELQIASSESAGTLQISEPIYNPKRLSEMISSREKMRQGRCVFPEALMMAEADRGIYLRTVVYGEITSDFKEQEVANRLMQTVRCDYTPMLMKNSVS
ncbi:MAG: hypothetical protein CVU26_03460 [Betaproteobacteria bacterium HGW-Betaproteobacteria-2]|nr:MAG: hypothetical protein CVU26_03460 [Betaproteobacteria bacterium HGW-Betaproteobacteria-2]